MRSVSQSCNATFSLLDEYVGLGGVSNHRYPPFHLLLPSHARTFRHDLLALPALLVYPAISFSSHCDTLTIYPTLYYHNPRCFVGARPHDEYQITMSMS